MNDAALDLDYDVVVTALSGEKNQQPIVDGEFASAPAISVITGDGSTIPESKWGQGLLAPVGLLDGEKPTLNANLVVPNYEGVIIPGNLIVYVMKLNELAANANVDVEIFIGGLLRLVRKYGVDAAEALLAQESIGEHDVEAKEYMNHIAALENIRMAVIKAIAEVLQLNSVGKVFSPMQQMMENPTYRKKVFGLIRELADGRGTIPFIFGAGDLPFVPQFSLKDALSFALPKKVIDQVKQQIHDDRPGLITREILYPGTELALAEYHSLDAGGTENRRRYVCPRGPEGGVRGSKGGSSIAEAIREVSFGRQLVKDPNGDLVRILKNRWEPSGDLDGLGFTVSSDGNPVSGKAAHIDPYYGYKNQLLPPLDGDSQVVAPPQSSCISQLIAIPHVRGNVSRTLSSPRGGGVTGQQADVMQGVVRPVIEKWIGTLPEASREAVMDLHYGARGMAFREWLGNKSRVVPMDGEAGLFGDWFKVVSKAIAGCAIGKLGGSGAEFPSNGNGHSSGSGGQK